MNKTEMKTLLKGRRVLHINSPVRWQGGKHLSNLCSNWKCMIRIIGFLPECHHFVTTPYNNEIEESFYETPNITVIPMKYPQSVTLNRAMFDYKPMLKQLNIREHDIDFVFCHQPELLCSVLTGLISKRAADRLSSFNFFHWVDSNVSRITSEAPEGYFRQLEGIHLSSKSFVHTPVSLDYLESNFKNKKKTLISMDRKEVDKKIMYMPTSSDIVSQKTDSTPFRLPKDKKILVFNHRWAATTNPQLMIQMTKNLGPDYLVWVTDKFALKPLAGKSIYDLLGSKYSNNRDNPNIIGKEHSTQYRVEKLPTLGEYRYLMENCHAEICFVNNYATWNLSCQDSIHLGRPAIAFKHPIMDHVLGKDYPFLFEDIEGFERCIENVNRTTKFNWILPDHDNIFRDNLRKALCESDCITKELVNTDDSKTWYKNGITWMYHILNGIQYKTDLALNTHPLIVGTNQWKHIRAYLLSVGIEDDHTSRFTKFVIPENKRNEIQKLVDDFIKKYGKEEIFKSVIEMSGGEVGTVLKNDDFKVIKTKYETNKKTFVENDFIKKSLGANDYKHIMKRMFKFLGGKVKPELLEEIEEKFESKNTMVMKSKKIKSGSSLSKFFN